MKCNAFIFFYSFYDKSDHNDTAKIMVLSTDDDCLKLPYVELSNYDSSADNIEKIIGDIFGNILTGNNVKYRLIDIEYSLKENDKSINIYYAAYIPPVRFIQMSGIQDVSKYTNNYMVRKFLCSI